MDHGKTSHPAGADGINTARVVILGAYVLVLAIGVVALFAAG